MCMSSLNKLKVSRSCQFIKARFMPDPAKTRAYRIKCCNFIYLKGNSDILGVLDKLLDAVKMSKPSRGSHPGKGRRCLWHNRAAAIPHHSTKMAQFRHYCRNAYGPTRMTQTLTSSGRCSNRHIGACFARASAISTHSINHCRLGRTRRKSIS